MRPRGQVGVYLTNGRWYGMRFAFAYPSPWPVPESGIPATKSTWTESSRASAAPQRFRTVSTLIPS